MNDSDDTVYISEVNVSTEKEETFIIEDSDEQNESSLNLFKKSPIIIEDSDEEVIDVDKKDFNLNMLKYTNSRDEQSSINNVINISNDETQFATSTSSPNNTTDVKPEFPDGGKKSKNSIELLKKDITIMEDKLQTKLNTSDISTTKKTYAEVLKNIKDKDDNLAFLSKPTTVDDNIDDFGEKAKKKFEALQALTKDIIIDSSTHVENATVTVEEILEKIERQNQKLEKTKLLYMNANLQEFPDGGKKLKNSIELLEKEITILEEKLQTKLNTSDISSTKNSYDEVPNNIKDEDNNLLFLSKPTTLDDDIDDLGEKAKKKLEAQQSLTIDRLKTLHGSLITQPTENDLAEDPRGLKVELMHHQKYALSWLLWREKQNPAGGILADDMGLGKTLTMISLILISMQEDNDSDSDDDDTYVHNLKYKGGTIIVCPASLIQQWFGEIENRCRKNLLKVLVHHGPNRESKTRRIARYDVVITTYETLVSEKKSNSALYKIRWNRIILDEAHVVRNRKSLKSEAVWELYGEKRWALTGTPVQNKAEDLFSIMRFLRCSPFDDLKVWKRWVDNKNEAGTQRLATVLKSLMLRRTKTELQNQGLINSMPEKFIDTVDITLTKEENVVYQKVLLYSQSLFAQFLHQQANKKHMNELCGGKFDTDYHWSKDTQFNKAQKKLLKMHEGVIKSHEILVLLLRLRQICCHPYLIKAMLDKEEINEANGMQIDDEDTDLASKVEKMNLSDEDILNESIGVDEEVVQNVLTDENPLFEKTTISSKMKVILNIIQDVVQKDEKIVVVSQWTNFLDIVASNLKKMNLCSFKEFSGRVPVKQREEIITKFNKCNRDPKILLLSLTAGGVGLNLIGANHLLILDIHWNPQLELQAHDRVYRLGQDKPVHVYRLLCKNTIEERVQALQERKLAISDSLLHGKKISSKLTLEDLKSLFDM